MTHVGTGVFLVGGAVRDALLHREVVERDWVVVGATREELLAAGFRQVGRDFPVFLHPQTNEEYALARTERKQGAGHHGFVVHAAADVTLEEDLRRRDLTINAIARSEDGKIIDPYGGVQDLQARVLRHVSPAFAEDPLRVYRVARFAAQLAPWGFEVAAETRLLMAAMARSGELAQLSGERVWAELVKALSCERGSTFVEVLRAANALAPWFAAWIECAPHDLAPPSTDDEWTLARRYAAFCADLDAEQLRRTSTALKAPTACSELARLLVAERTGVRRWPELHAEELLEVLQRCDALRRHERFTALCELVAKLDAPVAAQLPAVAQRLAALPLDLSGGLDPKTAVRAQRLAALSAWHDER